MIVMVCFTWLHQPTTALCTTCQFNVRGLVCGAYRGFVDNTLFALIAPLFFLTYLLSLSAWLTQSPSPRSFFTLSFPLPERIIGWIRYIKPASQRNPLHDDDDDEPGMCVYVNTIRYIHKWPSNLLLKGGNPFIRSSCLFVRPPICPSV